MRGKVYSILFRVVADEGIMQNESQQPRIVVNPLGEFIRAQREGHGWSQRDLARESGVSNGYIANLERGFDLSTKKAVRPSVEKLTAIGKGLRIDPQVLIRLAQGANSFKEALSQVAFANAREHIRQHQRDIVKEIIERYNQQLPSLVYQEDATSYLGRLVSEAIGKFYAPVTEDDEVYAYQSLDWPLFQFVSDRVKMPSRHRPIPDEWDDEWEESPPAPQDRGKIAIPEHVTEPPDDWELGVAEKIRDLHFGDIDPTERESLWLEPREVRRRILQHLEAIWLELRERSRQVQPISDDERSDETRER